ncbi:Retrovirus-related Pol polyprotein from transposon TNT 1-94 [Trichinella nativa]|uniref:Retrovirus-related Pol polyprotein from transposon TNT 1-94 n=1 Tax=Trichinella nativa TaxID=6335 RepID=A0A0V1KPM9_9BILA|nr:Retrovirus-related Pol polyprotein from transposon TNT 1-94 [Trichinella nativa]
MMLNGSRARIRIKRRGGKVKLPYEELDMKIRGGHNGENYSRWKFEIEAFLEARDCLDVVGGETICPPKDESEIKAWKKRDALARSIILRSLDDFHHAFIRSCKTSKEMMNCIVKIKEQVTVSSKLLVLSDFHAYTWKPGMNIASFIAGLNVIVNKMQSLQIELDDEIIIGKVIRCLPSDFDSFRQSWRLSAPKTVTLSDWTSQLLSCESDQLCRFMHAVSIGEALVGRRTTSKEPNENSKKRNTECWNCKKKGHIRSECRSQRKLNSSTLKDRTKSLNRTGFVARSWLDVRQEPNDGWLADSGAFKHITRNRHWFSTLEIIEPQGVRIGNDKMIYAVGIGTIDVEVFNGKQWIASVLNDVLYVPEFGSSCLFSLGAAAARGYRIMMDNFNIRLMMNNRTELVGYKDGDLYTLLIRRLSDNTSMSAMLTEGETHSFELWHQRLGHISVEKIKTMMQRKLVDGLRATAEEKFFCEGCVFGSMTRKPHKEVTERRQSVPGEILHADVCGPFIHPSVGGNRYFICFKDESSGYRKVYFMKTKDEVLRCLKIALHEIKQETGRDVQRIRTDGGHEFANREFDNLLTEKKIVHERSPHYTLKCNGRAERENRTPVEKARSMLRARNLPRVFGDTNNMHRVDEVTDVKFNESLQKRLVLIDGEEDSWMQTADKDEDDFLEEDITDDKTEKRGPGRPPGSRNKIKVISNPLKMELR